MRTKQRMMRAVALVAAAVLVGVAGFAAPASAATMVEYAVASH